jgi:hypothetical protein
MSKLLIISKQRNFESKVNVARLLFLGNIFTSSTINITISFSKRFKSDSFTQRLVLEVLYLTDFLRSYLFALFSQIINEKK